MLQVSVQYKYYEGCVDELYIENIVLNEFR